MRLRNKILIGLTCACGGLLIRELIECDKENSELTECLNKANEELVLSKHGIKKDNVIDIKFEEVQ